jgi:trehalose-6-phosphatase
MTLAVDFDGMIHAYSRGWADGTIYDPPVPGALDGLRQLLDQDAVFVFTAREPEQVAEWLSLHGFICRTEHEGPFWNVRGQLLVTNRKLPATAYLDDRAVRFVDWGQALAVLLPESSS